MNVSRSLGSYLRERRTRLDPVALGYAGGRRRTNGLRREEVAQRAGISATWYSWLEQGRGGAPSAHTLERVAEALMLTQAERDHLFLLGLGRLPGVNFRAQRDVTSRLQRVLNAMDGSPAIIRNANWDVVAWNKAASVVLADYDSLSATDRNVLRLMFLNPQSRVEDPDWEVTARFVVGVFRGDTARTGAEETVKPLIDELCAKSPDFLRLWHENEVINSCEGQKRLIHDRLGEITLEFSGFAVEGRPDLIMLVYTPIVTDDEVRIKALSAAAKFRSTSPRT